MPPPWEGRARRMLGLIGLFIRKHRLGRTARDRCAGKGCGAATLAESPALEPVCIGWALSYFILLGHSAVYQMLLSTAAPPPTMAPYWMHGHGKWAEPMRSGCCPMLLVKSTVVPIYMVGFCADYVFLLSGSAAGSMTEQTQSMNSWAISCSFGYSRGNGETSSMRVIGK